MDADEPNEKFVFGLLRMAGNIAVGTAKTESVLFGVHRRPSAVQMPLP
jgi:hypothetical protein